MLYLLVLCNDIAQKGSLPPVLEVPRWSCLLLPTLGTSLANRVQWRLPCVHAPKLGSVCQQTPTALGSHAPIFHRFPLPSLYPVRPGPEGSSALGETVQER